MKCLVVIGEVQLAENVSVWPFAVLSVAMSITFILAKIPMCKIMPCSMSAIRKPISLKAHHLLSVKMSRLVIMSNYMVVPLATGYWLASVSIILDDAIIEDDVMIGAGSLVPPRKRLESGYLYVGSPVQKVRPLTDKEKEFLPYSAQHYVKVANNYLEQSYININFYF